MDAALGHLVFSLKYDVIGDQEHLRLMLRCVDLLRVFLIATTVFWSRGLGIIAFDATFLRLYQY